MPSVSSSQTQAGIQKQKSLEEIYAPILRELALADALAAEVLASENELIKEISVYLARNLGKRMRSALVLLVCQACGPGQGGAVDETRLSHGRILATAVELLHSATLIHDDIVDNSPLRRGLKTPHFQWGKEISVLMGDYIFARVTSLVARQLQPEVIRTLTEATGTICEGEIKEVRCRFLVTQGEKDYFEIIEKKTASLMAVCCEAAGMVSGAGAETLKSLRGFGTKFGTAFQIADDLLDLVADPKKLGKPQGHDLREGKITLPLLHALSCAAEEERQKMRALLLKEPLEPADMARVMLFIHQHNGVEYAQAKARFFIEEAKAELAAIPQSPARASLMDLADYVLTREH